MFLIRSGDLFHNGLGLDPSAWALIEEEACFYKVFSAADKTANRLRNAGLVVTVEMRIPEEKTSDLAGLSENARLKVIALEKALDYYRNHALRLDSDLERKAKEFFKFFKEK